VQVEIIFHTASTPKVLDCAIGSYTKGGLLCCQLRDGLIIKYPLVNVFQVAHQHGNHLGTTQHDQETIEPQD
jgi:hypothetical protein